jgi:hypothetical protein
MLTQNPDSGANRQGCRARPEAAETHMLMRLGRTHYVITISRHGIVICEIDNLVLTLHLFLVLRSSLVILANLPKFDEIRQLQLGVTAPRIDERSKSS